MPEENSTPWTGEGLPPVRTVCEVTTNDGHNWHPVKIVFSDEYVTLVIPAEGKPNYTLLGRGDADVSFRPIRTVDQREVFSRELAAFLGWDWGYPATQEDTGRLFDAGYRKQVTP